MNSRSKHAGRLAGLLIATSFGLLSCGDSVPDSVFLYIINGYPASGGMTIIGPAGPIVSDAQFGDRMAADGPCAPGAACVPIEVDRRFGTDWTVLLEGMPQTTMTSKDLFAMYPQETGTYVLTRRSGETSIQGTLLRHTQSINAGCSLVMHNGLSTSNEYLDELTNYTIAPEFRVEPIENAGYFNELTRPFITECGELPIDEPEHQALARTALYQQIQSEPWFFPVDCQEEVLGIEFCYGWGVPLGEEKISRLQNGGQVIAARDTRSYYDCVQGAISIEQPEGDGAPLPFPPADAQVKCPPGDITWEDVQVDAEAVAECQEAVVMTSDTIDPATEDVSQTFGSFDLTFCDLEFRLRNQGQDIIFGPKGDDAEGSNQNGELITVDIEAKEGSQHFWVLLGRPVNPIIWQWDSTNSFVDLRASKNGYPYPNGKNEQIGEYDSIAD